MVSLRHGSTGVSYNVNGKSEGELTQLQLARLFSHHFSYSGGSVGGALTSWLTHVDRARTNDIDIRVPQGRTGEELDELRTEYKAVLVQLALHRRMTRQRLVHVSGVPKDVMDSDLAGLLRMGLVVEGRRGVLELNHYTRQLVTGRLERNGLL